MTDNEIDDILSDVEDTNIEEDDNGTFFKWEYAFESLTEVGSCFKCRLPDVDN